VLSQPSRRQASRVATLEPPGSDGSMRPMPQTSLVAVTDGTLEVAVPFFRRIRRCRRWRALGSWWHRRSVLPEVALDEALAPVLAMMVRGCRRRWPAGYPRNHPRITRGGRAARKPWRPEGCCRLGSGGQVVVAGIASVQELPRWRREEMAPEVAGPVLPVWLAIRMAAAGPEEPLIAVGVTVSCRAAVPPLRRWWRTLDPAHSTGHGVPL